MAKGIALAETEYKPRLYLEISDSSIIDKVKIGDQATFVVKGKIVGISLNRSEKKESCCIDLESFSVKAAPKNAFEEMADEMVEGE